MNRRHLLISAAATAASTALLPTAGAARQPQRPAPIRHPGIYVDRRVDRGRAGFIARDLDLAAFVGPLATGLPTGSQILVEPGMPLPAAFTPAAAVLDAYRAQGGQRALLVHAASNASGAPDLVGALDALDAASDTPFCLLYLVGAASPDEAPDAGLAALYQRALTSAQSEYATLIVDAPDTAADYGHWRTQLGLSDPDIAAYAPWLIAADGALIPPGPAVMGRIMARTAGDGVWKAPAGLQANISGYQARALDQDDLAAMNTAQVNPIWTTPGYGTVIWGARPCSSDPETLHLPVRRLQRWIEASLPASLDWARGEANAPALWNAVTAQIGAFLDGLFRHGAFQGVTASQAYFVQCGLGTTMTQSDIDADHLVVSVGFAPVRPAEFIVIAYEMSLQTD